MYVCMYVYVCVCMYACVYVCECMHVSMHVSPVYGMGVMNNRPSL